MTVGRKYAIQFADGTLLKRTHVGYCYKMTRNLSEAKTWGVLYHAEKRVRLLKAARANRFSPYMEPIPEGDINIITLEMELKKLY